MTRINCVPVEELHQKHLVAEYRELPRIFTLVKNYVEKHGCLPDIPENYLLGTGHVKFFYNKLLYLANRHKQLVAEMLKRGYNPSHQDCLVKQFINDIPSMCWYDWHPNQDDMFVNQCRISERLANMKNT
jgi:deoxyribonuclease (pyrimidine dimer)